MTELVVDSVGWATTIQDTGRPGRAGLGVSPGGALDAPFRDLLNRLVGNSPDAAVLETLGGLRVRATGPVVIATSARTGPITVRDGEGVDVGPAAGEVWGYLAVRGGIAVAPVLGSRSQDSRSGLGPPPLVDGVRLPVGPDPRSRIRVDVAPGPVRERERIGIWRGPRVDCFVEDALATLASGEWTVTADVSRVGARLHGPALHRAATHRGELDSEGLLTGAVQVPPDGHPVVMLHDRPTTGGYPVIAVVDPGSLASVVQTRPGATLRFRLLG